MIYVISDLHGFSLKKFKMLLRKARFLDNDFLYILGDVIDRNGDGGVELLCWIMEQKNIKFILGNHESMLLKNPILLKSLMMLKLMNCLMMNFFMHSIMVGFLL